jgi:hypothetical protein
MAFGARWRSRTRGSRDLERARPRSARRHVTETSILRWNLIRRLAVVEIEPRLASWDAAHHASQVRLRAYLDLVEAAFESAIDAAPNLALQVDVGLPLETDLLRHNDLENYLTPLAQRLRLPNLVRAGATKSLRVADEPSRVELWEAEAVEANEGR